MNKIKELRGDRLTNERFGLTATLVAFAAIAMLTAVDVGMDLRAGTSLGHVGLEIAVVVVGVLGAVFIGRRLAAAAREAAYWRDSSAMLAARLQEKAAEAQRWRDQASGLLRGLGTAIDAQLERWGLTRAEKEVALLLLKGLSHHDIATVRNITEATARQQARAVYRKAALEGRHELAAFFLEDLLLPMAPATPASPTEK